jgi:hypothetical protein
VTKADWVSRVDDRIASQIKKTPSGVGDMTSGTGFILVTTTVPDQKNPRQESVKENRAGVAAFVRRHFFENVLGFVGRYGVK